FSNFSRVNSRNKIVISGNELKLLIVRSIKRDLNAQELLYRNFGLRSFHTGYQNNHFLGIANLNLSYKRNLTNNIKFAFNPYLKLPLTDLGYGNIRLRSAGMSVGVITNLNKNRN
ncbi:hypothetical protein, partial [Daejeonella sp.]|uniref:hypothetical protein n=1 Tax=Daejeonella sp. TaxID=2805397 RepID=UPI0039838C21